MNTERDKFLTEAMGECWYEWKRSCGCCPGYCKKCGADEGFVENNDFSEWEDFGKLWTWAQKQEWFDLFQCCLYYHEYLKHCHRPGDERLDNDKVLHNELIHPDRFADAVCAFLKERA